MQICGSCHNRGKSSKVKGSSWPVGYRPGKALTTYYNETSFAGGDVKHVYANEFSKGHHQQYIDWQQSKHASQAERGRSIKLRYIQGSHPPSLCLQASCPALRWRGACSTTATGDGRGLSMADNTSRATWMQACSSGTSAGSSTPVCNPQQSRARLLVNLLVGAPRGAALPRLPGDQAEGGAQVLR